VLERSDPLKKASTKDTTESQVKLGLAHWVRRRCELLFERLRDCMPVMEAHLLLQPLL
jgi:hypothetical protein